MVPRHRDCKYFVDGMCKLKSFPVSEDGAICPMFEKKEEKI